MSVKNNLFLSSRSQTQTKCQSWASLGQAATVMKRTYDQKLGDEPFFTPRVLEPVDELVHDNPQENRIDHKPVYVYQLCASSSLEATLVECVTFQFGILGKSQDAG